MNGKREHSFRASYMKHPRLATRSDASFTHSLLLVHYSHTATAAINIDFGAFPAILRVWENYPIQNSVYDGMFLF